MKYQIAIAGLAVLLNIMPGGCYGEVYEANWWNSRTAASNINPTDIYQGSVRLWNALSGFAEGTLNLPASNRWVVRFTVNTDEDPIRDTNDLVRVLLNGTLIGEYRNNPASAVYTITFPFNGDRLRYRFDFLSSSNRSDLHQVVTAGIITVDSNVRIAGRVNSFGLPPTPSMPSAELAQILLAGGSRRLDFDQFLGDAALGQTFANISPVTEGATLWLRVRGFCCDVQTDSVEILFSDSENNTDTTARAWLRSLGRTTNAAGEVIDPGLVKNTPWAVNDVAIIKLDLSALPLADGGTTNLLEMVKAKGFFDVVVADDSAVDYALLDLTPGNGTPLGLEIEVVDIQTELGKNYQVQVSGDMTNWVNWGAPFVGNGERSVKIVSTRTAARKFYRVIEGR